jgi:phosphoadenosine phosphosulfate reductase
MMHAVSSLDEAQIEAAPAEERIRVAYQHYGERLVLSTSFGVQSAVMLHMVTQIVPQIPILFIDTGYLFPETYRFAAELGQRLSLNLKTFRSQQSAAQQEALYGKLWEQGLDGLKRYNELNKVEPMNRAITQLGAQAWISGLRRVQSNSRKKRPAIEKQNKIVKLYPIIDWSDKAIYDYLTQHDLPYHPLWDQGYVSVGDWHSTSKLSAGMHAEDTRFGGLKRECGLHESNAADNYQI